jgi:hypothetical protein
MGGATLASALALSDVSISTPATHTGSELGDIHVNAAVSWSVNKLTLTAHHDININAVMSASDTASLDLQPAGHVNVGFSSDGNFAGRVDFLQADGTSARTGVGFLKMGQNDYTVIGSAAQLQAMAAGTHYALGANITASEPFTAVTGFTTNFDGLGHTIADLAISGGANTGLFATATNASIQNVGLLGGSVSGEQPQCDSINWPGGGGFVLNFPLQPGDRGWIEASDRDISLWMQGLAPDQRPNTLRLHSFQDARFLPDVFRGFDTSDVGADAMTIQSLGGAVRVELSPSRLRLVAPTIKMDATAVEITADTVDITGDVATTGTLTNNGVNVGSTHTHGGVQTGGGTSGPPSP